ncbi:MAG: hypothetical protein QNK05_09605 [Myxococcota bacterium]|nr:hypothetical protein [Myxococcota bacterium]
MVERRSRMRYAVIGLATATLTAGCASLDEPPPEVDCEEREVNEEIAVECWPASRSLLEH